jgi:prepilin-type N-terminal cleavage/methylation domain-containing protein
MDSAMKANRSDGTRRAFTLVELLVVISIIAVLLSMLLPSIGKAKQQAKRIECLNKLRQTGTVTHLYIGDNDEMFPQSHRVTVGVRLPVFNPAQYLCHYLGMHVMTGSGDVYDPLNCPCDETPYGEGPLVPDSPIYDYSYAVNDHVNANGTMKYLRQVTDPSQHGFVVDSNDVYGTQEANATTRVSRRHFYGVNILFVDASVRYFKGYGVTNPELLWSD